MESGSKPTGGRKPRADALRNREIIIEVAKAAFTEFGANASLDEIAKRAGVGPGTLYRHFPTRVALLEAVYSAEVDHLAEAAYLLSEKLPPIDALRAWMMLFIDHLATKKVIGQALQSLAGGHEVFEKNLPRLHRPIALMYEKAVASGDMRPDINPLDHMLAIVGVTFFGSSEDWRDSATRLVEMLLQGSRPLQQP